MKIGVDYYPEHWDPALWEQDADLMKQSGVRTISGVMFSMWRPKINNDLWYRWSRKVGYDDEKLCKSERKEIL